MLRSEQESYGGGLVGADMSVSKCRREVMEYF